MANRSYLFSIDKIPESYSDRPEWVFSLSEWPYDIPLSYLLLVSEKTRACPSLSFRAGDPDNPPLALVGEAEGGLDRLLRFLDLLAGTPEGAGDPEFLRAVEDAKAFIDDHLDDFVYVETAELDDMSDEPFAASTEKNLAKVRKWAEIVDLLTPDTIEQAMAPGRPLEGVLRELGKFEERDTPTLGVTFWSEILYLAPRSRAEFEPEEEDDIPPPESPPPPTSPVEPAAEPSPKRGWLSRLFGG